MKFSFASKRGALKASWAEIILRFRLKFSLAASSKQFADYILYIFRFYPLSPSSDCGFSATQNFFSLLLQLKFRHRNFEKREREKKCSFCFYCRDLWVCGIVQLSESKFLYGTCSISVKLEENFSIYCHRPFARNVKLFSCVKNSFSPCKPKKPLGKLLSCRWRIRSTVCCIQESSWLFLFSLSHCECRLCMLDENLYETFFCFSFVAFPRRVFVTLLCNRKFHGD